MKYNPAQLENIIKNLSLQIKCIILFGTNEGEIATLQKKCAEAICGNINDPFRYSLLEMENISKDGQEIYAEFYAQSLMGGRRAIVVKNADNSLAKILKDIIPNTNSENILVLTSSSLNTKSSVINWSKDRSDIIICGCYEDRDSDKAESISLMLKEKNININLSSAQFLYSKLSADRKINQSEIDKLDIYLGDRRQADIQDINAVISDVAGTNYEDLCYFIAEGNILKAEQAYQRLLEEGENAAVIVRQITYHFYKLLECIAYMEDGKNSNEAIRALRPSLMFYREKSFSKQLSVWKKEKIFNALQLLYECEKNCKTTGFPAEQNVSYTIMRIANAAKKMINN